MFEVTVNTRRAVVGSKELITTSSAGIHVQFTFSEDWDGLSRFAIFRNGDEGQEVAVPLPNSNLTVIPAQSCSEEYVDEPVFVGVYGTDGLGAVAIPTIWTSLGVLRPGAVTTDIITPAEPTPDMWAQILLIANEAAAIADECEENEELRVAAEQLRADAETVRANAETFRAQAETERSVNETQRQSAETQRQTAEDARARAETLRVQAEELRQANEANRASAERVRASDERSRQSHELERDSAESLRGIREMERINAEWDRQSAETARASAETSRASAESSRATAEQNRASAETVRTSAESARATAESTRASNEQSRVSAEAARAQAETDRATEFATWKSTIDSKADQADVDDLTRQLNDSTTGLDTKAPVILETASGAIASFSDGADSMPIRKIVATIEPVQAGTGDPSPDNVRPISGHTGAEIQQTGVNIWDEEWENGTFNTTTGNNVNTPATETQIRAKNLIPITPNTTYYICAPSDIWCIFYDINKNIIVNPPYNGDIQRSGNSICLADIYRPATHKYTTPENARYFKFYCIGAYGNTYKNDISINYPETDTTYHPYTGNQISVTFPSEAGTVYGGSDEVISGKLKSTMGMVDLGTLKWSMNTQGQFFTTLPQASVIDPNGSTVICSMYKSGNAYSSTDKAICIAGNAYRVWARDSAYSDAATFKAAVSGAQLCYKLATPIEYTFSANELSTFLGTNNIWADTGDVEVTYPCDTRLYIDNKITQAIANALNS